MLASSAALVSTAFFVRELSAAPSITVDGRSFLWAQSVHWSLSRENSTPTPEPLNVAQLSISDLPKQGAAGMTITRVHPGKSSASLSKVLAKLSNGIDELGVEAIHVTQAAPQPEPKRNADSGLRKAPAPPSAEELNTVQQIHRTLQTGFVTALLQEQTPVVEVASAPTQVQAKAKPSKVNLNTQPVVATQGAPAAQELAAQIEPIETRKAQFYPKISQSFHAVTGEAVSAAETRVNEAKALAENLNHSISSWKQGTIVAAAPVSLSQNPREVTDAPTITQLPVVREKPSEPKMDVVIHSAFSPLTKATQAPDYPKAVAQAPTVAQASVPTHEDSAPKQEVSNTQLLTQDNRAEDSWVEAFNWEKNLPVGRRDELSQLWQIARTPAYWPTLLVKSARAVPLMSQQSATLLAWGATTRLQNEMGIVFGKVPTGWTVEFSGRAEKPLFLGEGNRPVPSNDISGTRFFAFVNAEPGAHLVYISSREGAASGAIVVPVMAGAATFVDLEGIRVANAAGHVLDASNADTQGLKGVRVTAIGNSKHEGVLTQKDGSFRIPRVAFHPEHPIVLEAEALGGFTHRYQARPADIESLSLFRLGENQVQTWIGQLEGGVSPESGLVLAAIPPEVIASVPVPAFPGLRSLNGIATLVPETYTLSAQGQLEVKAALDATHPRFIGVQVPEGPVIAEVRTKAGEAVWSELLVASPRVINLVAP